MAKPSSWLWADEYGGTQGVTVDYGRGKLLWYDNPGCACGDSAHEQSIADFLQKGSRYADPPDDVLAEMRAALAEESPLTSQHCEIFVKKSSIPISKF